MSGGVPSIRAVFFGSGYLLDLLERSADERQTAPPAAGYREDVCRFFAVPPPARFTFVVRSRISLLSAEDVSPTDALTVNTLTWECPWDWKRRAADGDPLYYRCTTPFPSILKLLREREP